MKLQTFLFSLVALLSLNAFAAGNEECTSETTTVRFESLGNDRFNVVTSLNSTNKAYKTIPGMMCKFMRDGSHTFFCKGKDGQKVVTVRSMYTTKQFLTSESSPVRTAFRYTIQADYWNQNTIQHAEEMMTTPQAVSAVKCSF